MLYNHHPQAITGNIAHIGSAVKHREQQVQTFRRNTNPFIRDTDSNVVNYLCHNQLNRTARGRILHRIREQIIQQALFTLFHRASNVGDVPGYGLGLVIVQQVAQVHNGSVSVESQVGKGTTFTVSLPLKTRFQPQQESHETI
jgi:light-regulated signal transduction histidine kinase (bacteriophytochrome)